VNDRNFKICVSGGLIMVPKGLLTTVGVIVLTLCSFNSPLNSAGGKQSSGPAEAKEFLHHDLNVSLSPTLHKLEVSDTLTLTADLVRALQDNKKIHFLLHGNLKPVSVPDNIVLQEETGKLKSEFFGINTAKFEITKKIPLTHFSLRLKKNDKKTPVPHSVPYSITLTYSGIINHPIMQSGAEYARGFSETPGIIDAEGSYLAGASFWVPWFNDGLMTFKLETVIPDPFDTVSQGTRIKHQNENGRRITIWESPEPMDEIYLSAAKFYEYGLKVGKTDIQAFLRSKDEGLANKYLETTGQYLEMYEKLIGPYPYSKFALIENFWETGYGMPSFTLLGAKIIRFPFILHSSYPHELLHNWWGNSVFVDYLKGNWCEGLTAYMADHLIKEQRGQGESYRKTTLQGYTHYAAGKKEEFPLTQFKARYDALSSAIGYGKTMMLFHMLRMEVGDEVFTKAMQHFYKNNKFIRADFHHMRRSFDTVTGKDFTAYFKQWVTRTGAPELRIKSATLGAAPNNKSLLKLTLEQVQDAAAYALKVPVAITSSESADGKSEAVIKLLDMNQKVQSYELEFKNPPLIVEVDPQFDIFRKLHINEIPPVLSSAFGAEAVLILLPTEENADLAAAYAQLAESWADESNGKITIKQDKEVPVLPVDKAVWIIGRNNRHTGVIQTGIKGLPVKMKSSGLSIENKPLAFDDRSIIISVKNPGNPSQVVVFLTADRTAAVPGLGRKLPHYGSYSYLAFEGDEPSNLLKGQWPAVDSPLSVQPQSIGAQTKPFIKPAKLPVRRALAVLVPIFSADKLMDHVKFLAAPEQEGRGPGSEGLERAAQYIAESFKASGLVPAGDDGSYVQQFSAVQGAEKKPVQLKNIVAFIPGTDPQLAGEAAVICAHYDHLGMADARQGNAGKIHPGADDNASGTAVLLELARVLGTSHKPTRSIVFIAFSGEESGLLGSAYYVNQLKSGKLLPVKTVTGVINMDTVGRLLEKDKLMVIGGASAREWKFIFMGIGYTVGIESQMITQQLDASDQVPFIKAGIPGIQLFSGPNLDYHRPSDTVDKIESAGLVKVAAVAREAIVYLGDRKEPLTAEGPAAQPQAAQSQTTQSQTTQSQTGRRVRTGIMPDFAFKGKGVRISMVSPDSPVHKVGFLKGDILIKVNGQTVADMREYSDILKTFTPGDQISLTILRDGKEETKTITLGAR